MSFIWKCHLSVTFAPCFLYSLFSLLFLDGFKYKGSCRTDSTFRMTPFKWKCLFSISHDIFYMKMSLLSYLCSLFSLFFFGGIQILGKPPDSSTLFPPPTPFPPTPSQPHPFQNGYGFYIIVLPLWKVIMAYNSVSTHMLFSWKNNCSKTL